MGNNRFAFPEDFLWGAATAAPQIEGAYNEDKGLTIWDTTVEGNVRYGENCKVACDHYHRYKEDVALMKEIGLNSYRFSVSWARIFNDDKQQINKNGLNFYKNLVDELVKNGIEPVCTLFHWDMPMWVYEKGGFLSDEFVSLFANYVKTVVEALSDKIRYWITFNEPQCFVHGGYEGGWLAPFQKNGRYIVEKIIRNVMLAHGEAVMVIRKYARLTPKIGFAPTASLTMPVNDDKEEIERAYNCTFDGYAGLWGDPIVKGIAGKNCDFLSEADLKNICQPLDFYAFNVYRSDNSAEVYKQGMPRSALGWEIVPESMYWAAVFAYRRYGLPIFITENGIACEDFVYDDGKVYDPQRSYYIEKHIEQLNRAAKDGVPIIGYEYWSLMDNFEWAVGYDARFGLIYVDYATQKRTIKQSAYDYKKIISLSYVDR